ncbi:hypothetical protein EV659_1095 [Rhodothalassium salexigens DSM 2132]|uniref:Uncharacterized protein n=1 Tax=Rhodothalassium salexigens DSM 2132 TaxID=1188247 RepID=A0A4R2PBK7_RHOSA|nr:hypothetical protein [Rhodothalassium salexigens]MBB4212336.1 hypothetical protein [Rhodothalassium salexigens DSM 2132]MBK1638836.1 hypothetical protein [Rhodothalassium salexigens DSM 2132]TCP32513.1 hypothetical protein EV659_1095 [Rhodothalassium salexigens DSM 2132]
MPSINPNSNLLSALGTLFGGPSQRTGQVPGQSPGQPDDGAAKARGDTQDPRRQAMIDEFRARQAQRRSSANPLSSNAELRAASDRVRALGGDMAGVGGRALALGAGGIMARQPLGQVVDIFV